jgi:hypothetical protein
MRIIGGAAVSIEISDCAGEESLSGCGRSAGSEKRGTLAGRTAGGDNRGSLTVSMRMLERTIYLESIFPSRQGY